MELKTGRGSESESARQGGKGREDKMWTTASAPTSHKGASPWTSRAASAQPQTSIEKLFMKKKRTPGLITDVTRASCASRTSRSSIRRTSSTMTRRRRETRDRSCVCRAALGSNGGNGGGGPKKICILGGGFGGLYTALRLSTLVWPGNNKPEISLVDMRDRFVFKPLLYELLTEELDLDEVAPRFENVLSNSGIKFVKGKVAGLRAKDEIGDDEEESKEQLGKVVLENGSEIAYDYLVVAFGSGTKLDLVEGAREHASPFCNLEDAIELKSFLRTSRDDKKAKRTVAIVGGGVNGVELAASLCDKYKNSINIQMLTPGGDILESYPKPQRQNAWNSLSLGRVDVRLGTKVTKVDVDPDSERYRLSVENVEYGKDTLLADKILWTAGQEPVPVPIVSKEGKGEEEGKESSFFVRNKNGNVLTDATLRMVGSSYVFALGDIAVQDGSQEKKLSLTAQVAFQQSDYVAWNVWSAINGQPLLPFQYQHLGDMMSLGASEATVALPIGGLNLTGLPASLLRKSAYVYRMPTLEAGVKLGVNWASKLIREQLQPSKLD